jgi:NAD-dependent deacetylase
MNRSITELAKLIRSSPNTIFFGGAGVSTESGIPDFRSETGLYKAVSVYGRAPEELISHSFFVSDPVTFFKYYKGNLVSLQAKPNKAHYALAGLESAGLLAGVITQNIDGLHQEAGSLNVCELHGSNLRHYCVKCKSRYTLSYIMNPENCQDGIVPICKSCGGMVRPDVVLYEESLDNDVMIDSAQAFRNADLVIVGGTSLAVYPAAGLIDCFSGGHIVIINKSSTPYDNRAHMVFNDSIGKTFSELMKVLDLPYG